MSNWTPEQYREWCRKNDKVPDCASEQPSYRNEAELQAAAEKMLDAHGFKRLTEKNIIAYAWSEIAGWYFHLHDARGECCLSDLVIFDSAMQRCLCVELKASVKSKVRRAQKIMFTTRRWPIVCSIDELAGLVATWRGGEG